MMHSDKKTYLDSVKDYINSDELNNKLEKILNDLPYAKGKDDDPYNPWHDNRKVLKDSINRIDAAGLQMLHVMNTITWNVHQQNEEIANNAKLVVSSMLENAIGNTALNKFLIQAHIKNGIGYDNYLSNYNVIDSVAYFAHKTRRLKEVDIDDIMERASRLYNASQIGEEVQEADMLTLKEMSILIDLSDLYNSGKCSLKTWEKSGYFAGNAVLTKLCGYSKTALDIYNYMDNNLELELTNNDKVPSGIIIIVDDIYKHATVRNIILSFWDRIKSLFCRYEHAGLLSMDLTEETIVSSELVKEVGLFDYEASNYLYADMYQLDVIALIPEHIKPGLRQTYGDDWEQKVMTITHEINEETINKVEESFSRMGAGHASRELKAGLANIIPFGHKKLGRNDWKEIHDKVKNNHYSQENTGRSGMLCSEFCATNIVATLVAVEQKIKDDMKEAFVVGSHSAIDNTDIIKIPFGKHENLQRMHPDRLLHVLKEHNCLKPFSSNTVEQFMQKDSKKAVLGKFTKAEAVREAGKDDQRQR